MGVVKILASDNNLSFTSRKNPYEDMPSVRDSSSPYRTSGATKVRPLSSIRPLITAIPSWPNVKPLSLASTSRFSATRKVN